MSRSHVSPAGLVTRQRRRFQSCFSGITDYRPAGTEPLDAPTETIRNLTPRKRKYPIDLEQARCRHFCKWPIAPFQRGAEFDRYQRLADIGHPCTNPARFQCARPIAIAQTFSLQAAEWFVV